MPASRFTGCTIRLRVPVLLLFPTVGISGAIVEATRVTVRTRRWAHLRVPALGPEDEHTFRKNVEKAVERLEAAKERLGKLSVGT